MVATQSTSSKPRNSATGLAWALVLVAIMAAAGHSGARRCRRYRRDARTSSSSSATTWALSDIGAFGSEIKTPNLDSLAKRRRALHQLLHPRQLLADALDVAQRRRHARQRPRQHGRVDRAQPARRARLRGLSQRPRDHAAAGAQGRRLPHLHGRQVAPRQEPRPDSGGARLRTRLLAARWRRQLLGHDQFHRRVAEVGLHRGRQVPDRSCPRTTTRPRPTPTS